MDKNVKGGRWTVEVDPRKPAKGGLGVVGSVWAEGFNRGLPIATVKQDSGLHPPIRLEMAKPSEGFTPKEARRLARLLIEAAAAQDPKSARNLKKVKATKKANPDWSGGRGRIGNIA